MNVIFLSLLDFNSIKERNMYTDLLRYFTKHGHKIFAVSPVERRTGNHTYLIKEEMSTILKLRIGNMRRTNVIEKGISTVMFEEQLLMGIKKYFKNVKFDLVLYCTPPITFYKAVRYIKKRDNARTYLMLKDIFPQNAVDIGMMSKEGVKGLLYKYFRNKEKRLYNISDSIGCMSEANVQYMLKANPYITASKIEICPNCIEPVDLSLSSEEKKAIRDRYHIPQDQIVFIYGGNLGKPQGIEFMVKCIHSQRKNKKIFFLIIGNGTEYGYIEHYINKYKPKNILLYQWLPKEEYDKVVASCDVGLIFLDYRFTIPNFPSRLLGYMNAKIPVLAVTDPNTDVGKVITKGGFGWWCASDNVEIVSEVINKISQSKLTEMGKQAFRYLGDNYSAILVYKQITRAFFKEI